MCIRDRYTPGETSTVSPAEAAFIAAWMLVNCCGTSRLVAFTTGKTVMMQMIRSMVFLMFSGFYPKIYD